MAALQARLHLPPILQVSAYSHHVRAEVAACDLGARECAAHVLRAQACCTAEVHSIAHVSCASLN